MNKLLKGSTFEVKTLTQSINVQSILLFEADLDIINSLTSSTMADGLALVMSKEEIM